MKIAGMTKTSAKALVSPRKHKPGFTTHPSEIDFDDVRLYDNSDMAGLRFEEPFGASWRNYHGKYSILDVLTPEEHLAEHRKDRTPP